MSKRGTDLIILAAVAMLLRPWIPARARPVPVLPSVTPERLPPGVSAAAIPPRRWWNIVRQVAIQFAADRIMAEAAGVTFFTLLAIFPGLAALVSIYGMIADPHGVSGDLSGLAGLIPGGGMDLINDQLKRLTESGQRALGFGALIGFATSLWSANAGMKALFDALNAVYEQRETRGFVRLTLLSLSFTISSLLFMIVAMTMVVVLPAVLSYVGFGWTTDMILRVARWPMLLAAFTLFLAFLYRFGPSRARTRWRWLSPGGVFSAVAWIIASAGFSWYVANFGSYNRTYGSLGAVVGFMTWIWISAMIILTGAELNAQIEDPGISGVADPTERR